MDFIYDLNLTDFFLISHDKYLREFKNPFWS